MCTTKITLPIFFFIIAGSCVHAAMVSPLDTLKFGTINPVKALLDVVNICDRQKIINVACKTCQCLPAGFDVVCHKALDCLDSSTATDQSNRDRTGDRTKTTDEFEKCIPHSFFHLYCNTCACSSDGTNMACTVKSCPPGMFNIDGSLVKGNEALFKNVNVLSKKKV